jgi:hypothetical protein
MQQVQLQVGTAADFNTNAMHKEIVDLAKTASFTEVKVDNDVNILDSHS